MKKFLFCCVALCAIVWSGCGVASSTASSSRTAQEVQQAASDLLKQSESDAASEAQERLPQDGVLVIQEKMFLTQINDIYYNFDTYADATVQLEGMFSQFTDGETFLPVVYRNGPGCCGNDGWGGFFLQYDGELPQENAWISVTGTPVLIDDGLYTDLWLKVETLEVIDDSLRGAEYVAQ